MGVNLKRVVKMSKKQVYETKEVSYNTRKHTNKRKVKLIQ